MVSMQSLSALVMFATDSLPLSTGQRVIVASASTSAALIPATSETSLGCTTAEFGAARVKSEPSSGPMIRAVGAVEFIHRSIVMGTAR